jgi:hypothetical protein
LSKKAFAASNNKYWAFIPIWPIWAWAFFRIEKLRLGSLIIVGISAINIGINYVIPFPYGLIIILVGTPWVAFYFLRKWTIDWNAQFPLDKEVSFDENE